MFQIYLLCAFYLGNLGLRTLTGVMYLNANFSIVLTCVINNSLMKGMFTMKIEKIRTCYVADP